ncbi:helix-turn-helix transcriptional regulator [Nocardia sp. NPDC058499]|uniref:helix-turn-helix transcriptional regulator n=1 Tax=Nocardia sp. NPDC058499 TaxID=3346530 RepID=UPI0036486036
MIHGRAEVARRTELTAFLRNRRGRIAPADVGIAPGVRRRTPGLRREEVALLAGVSVTWYTWLEQGRTINASAQVLDSVAEVLRLTAAERAHLFELVHPAPAVPADGRISADIQTVLDALEPTPACVYDGKFDLLASNTTYATVFPELSQAPRNRRNLLLQVCASVVSGEPLGNRHMLPRMVAVVRANYARHTGDTEWSGFIEQLREFSPEFAALWSAHQVAEPFPEVTSFQRPPVGEINMRATALSVVAVPESQMMVYLPVTEEDTQKITDFCRRE